MYANERKACKDRTTEYQLPGCVTGCKYGSIETRVERETCPLCGSTFVRTSISPECSRIELYMTRREEIFQRAKKACDDMMPINWRKAHTIWLDISAEYREQPCPFFEPTGQSGNA